MKATEAVARVEAAVVGPPSPSSSEKSSSSNSSMNGEKGMWHGTIALTSGQEVASQIKAALQSVQNAQHCLHGGREIGFFDSLVEDSLQASRCASSDCACFAVQGSYFKLVVVLRCRRCTCRKLPSSAGQHNHVQSLCVYILECTTPGNTSTLGTADFVDAR